MWEDLFGKLLLLGVVILILAAGGAIFVLFRILQRDKRELSMRLLLEEQSREIWLDYSFRKRLLRISGARDQLFGGLPSNMRGEGVYEVYDWVHRNDGSIRSGISNFLDSAERHYETELRIRNADGDYSWYSLQATLTRDKMDVNKRLVVVLKDINKERSQEKKLQQRAENDLLTGIYNKKTMEKRVREALAERKDDEHQIFFMIDIDNFKKINDTLGHIYGDKVIDDTAARLKEIFKVNAAIGRLGGDEFAVCTSFEAFDADNLRRYIQEKAEIVRKALKATYANSDTAVEVSCSIGIAVAPDFGTDFETIYQKADKALYLSKRSGKDRFNIYKNSSTNL